MSKINDNFKKRVDSFNKQINDFKRQTPKKQVYRDVKIDDVKVESNKLSSTYGKYITGFDYKVPRDTDVSDVGLDTNALNKNVLYSSDNSGVAPKKMRRIKSDKDSTLDKQNKMMSHMFRNQSNFLTKLHSEKMTMSAKFNNTLISHVKNISDQVSQINKVKNSVQLDFYTNSLSTQNSILEELKSINATLKTGFNLNDRGERNVNRQTDSFIKQLFSGSGSLKSKSKQLMKHLAKEGADQLSGGNLGMATMTLSMLPTMLMGMGGIKGLITTGLKGGINTGVNQLGKRNRTFKQAASFLNNPGNFLEDVFTAWGISGKGVKKWIGRKAGRKDGKAKIYDISSVLNKDHKGRAHFDMEAHTALTRVITRYLSRIESTLSGKPLMYYNYHTHRFETPEEAKKMLAKGESSQMKKEIEDLEKRIISSYKVKKNVFGEMKDVEEDGLWKQLSKITNDVKDANLDFVQKSIQSKGQQLGEYLIRLVAFLARYTSEPGKILDTNIDIKILMRAIHGTDAVKNADRNTINKMAESAFAFKSFLEALRDLPQKEAKKVWNTLLAYANNIRDNVTSAMDDAFEEAEGSIAAWEKLTYKAIYDETKKRMRGATRHELDKDFSDSKKDFSFLSSNIGTNIIDLSGITTEEQMKQKLVEEYNKMVGPLFLNGANKAGANLKAKLAQLKKQNHMFAPYLETLVNAYERTGLTALEGNNYAKASGLNTYSDLLDATKPPEMHTWTVKDTVKSAKNVAQWHIENNAKIRGIAKIGAAGAYASLISTMAESSGMTGPIGSMLLGVGAASTVIFSGKLSTAVDIMTTSLGDEKMVNKDGKVTNVTKRQALMEATYKEMLPKTWGMKQGMKIGGWVRNNVRLGPILGPVVGFATGKLLGGTATWVVKLGSLFGKMGKGLMNSLGRKFTGDENMSWGDNIRDLMRTAMGLAPAGEDSFTMNEVMKQSGAKSGAKNLANVAGYDKGKKLSIEERYKAAKTEVLRKNGPNYNFDPDNRWIDPNTNKEEEPKNKFGEVSSVKESVETTLASTLQIRLVGGNLDAVSAIGAVDAESYKNRLQSLARSASQDVKKSVASGTSQQAQENIKKAINTNLQDSIQFATNNKEFKDEYEDQDKQEETEIKDRDNIQRIADEINGVSKKKSTKKKARPSLAAGALAGFLFLPQLLEGAQKAVPAILDTLNPINWGKKGMDAFNFTADTFYQKRQPGDVLPDGKISLLGDMWKFFRHFGTNAKHAAILGKVLWGAAKMIPGVKTLGKVGKFVLGGAAELGSKLGGKLLSKAVSKVDDIAIKIVSEGAENVIKGGWRAFGKTLNPKAGSKMGKILGYVYKGLEFLGKLLYKIPGVKNFAKYLAEGIVPYAKKLFTELIEKFADKIVKKGGTVAASKSFLGAVKGVLTSGIVTAVVNLAFIAWDAWQGAKRAKEFFGIPEGDNATAWQTYACAVVFGTMSLIECIPGCFVVTAVLSSMDSVMKWLCFRFYDWMMAIMKPLGVGDSDANIQHYENEKNKVNKKIAEESGLDNKENFSEKAQEANELQQSLREEGKTNEQIAEEISKIYSTGGTGQRYHTSIDSTRLAGNDAPTFFSQRELERRQIGSMNTNDDGCALAVMKMIAHYKGVKIDDGTLTRHMHRHILSNRSVSTAFFEDFGGKITSSRDDIKSTLLSGRAIMALLIQNRGYKHFVAIIAKDKKSVYVGDPLKKQWEVMSNTDNKLITYSVAAAIFQGGIVTGIGLPGLKKQGGTGAGGFGQKARDIQSAIWGNSPVGEKIRKMQRNILNIFNNQSAETMESEPQMNPGAGLAGGLTFNVKSITDNGGWRWDQLPPVSGKGYKNMAPLINALSTKFNIPADAITAMMYLESSLDPNQATGSYRGLGQLNATSWNATLTESLGGIKYNGAAYGVPAIGKGGVLTDPRQNGTLFLARMVHDAKVLAKNGIDNISTGMLHMTHMLPTAMNYIGKSNPNLMEMAGMKRAYIDSNARLTTDTEKPGGRALSLNESIAKFNADHIKKLAEAKGGNGGPRSVGGENPYEEVQYYGRGIGVSAESIKTCFVKQRDVGNVLGLTGNNNTTCGIACALMLQKLVYFNDHKRYDAKAVKRYADEKKLFDKDLGVSQRFFLGFGMQKYDIDAIRAKEGKVKIATFANQDRKGNSKGWGIQNWEIAILNAGGHWVLLIRQGGIPWLLDPMQNGPINLFERRDLAQKDVDYAVHSKDAGRIINILSGQASHIGGLGSGSEGKLKKGGVVSSDPSTSSTTNTSSVTSDATTASNVEETPIRGTSASLGGWFYKGEDGQLKQFFFGNKVKKLKTANGSTSTLSTGNAPWMAEAERMVGKSEDDPEIRALNPSNVSWCALFVSHCLKKAGLNIPTFASSQEPRNNSTYFRKLDNPIPGCIIVWTNKSSKGDNDTPKSTRGHIGFYVGPGSTADKILHISGNTWEGATNGGKPSVLKKERGLNTKNQSFGGYYWPIATGGTPTNTPNKTGGDSKTGAGGDKDTVIKSVTNSVSNYYSTGSMTYNTDKVYNKTVEQAKKTTDTYYGSFTPVTDKDSKVKRFQMSNDRSRNLSLSSRDSMAKAKYYRETRKLSEGQNNKRWGILNVKYKDTDDVVTKSISVASGAIQDVKTKSPVINALLELGGALLDNTVQNKLGTQNMLETNKKHTEVLNEQTESTKEAGKAIEKKDIPIVTIMQTVNRENINKSFANLFGDGQQKKSLFSN